MIKKTEAAFDSAQRNPMEKQPEALPLRLGRHLTRNLALAGMALLTAAAIHNAQWPSGQTVLTAVQGMVDGGWDERLGKISFVSALFPDAVSVFFESPGEETLVAPCLGEISHAWAADEPYIGYTAQDSRVFSVAPGQVMSVARGEGKEWVVRVRQQDGLETLYYGLASADVREGDALTEQSCLGRALSPGGILIEVRRGGLPIDPTEMLSPRREALP